MCLCAIAKMSDLTREMFFDKAPWLQANSMQLLWKVLRSVCILAVSSSVWPLRGSAWWRHGTTLPQLQGFVALSLFGGPQAPFVKEMNQAGARAYNMSN